MRFRPRNAPIRIMFLLTTCVLAALCWLLGRSFGSIASTPYGASTSLSIVLLLILAGAAHIALWWPSVHPTRPDPPRRARQTRGERRRRTQAIKRRQMRFVVVLSVLLGVGLAGWLGWRTRAASQDQMHTVPSSHWGGGATAPVAPPAAATINSTV